jgi:hypothetical protein
LILHADDLALPNFLTRNLEIIRRCDERVASVSSNHFNFDQSSERLALAEQDLIVFRAGTHEEVLHTALVGCWWHISGALVNKKLWLDFGGWNKKIPLVGDWDLVLRWQKNGYTVGHSLIATTKYRLAHASSLSIGSYAPCTDWLARTEAALGLPEIFYGRTKRIFAFRVLKTTSRRGLKLLLHGKISLAINAFKVGMGSCLRLLTSQRTSGRSFLRPDSESCS